MEKNMENETETQGVMYGYPDKLLRLNITGWRVGSLRWICQCHTVALRRINVRDFLNFLDNAGSDPQKKTRCILFGYGNPYSYVKDTILFFLG